MTAWLLPLSIAVDHPAYAGHFPGQPILPGAILLDEALQAIAAREGRPAALGTLQSAKFPSPVRPGDALRLRYAATASGAFRFEVAVGERIAASGIFAFAPSDPGVSAP